MKMTRTYSREQDWGALIKSAEYRLEELKLQRAIATIDDKLEQLRRQREAYPPHKADDEQPCALEFPS